MRGFELKSNTCDRHDLARGSRCNARPGKLLSCMFPVSYFMWSFSTHCGISHADSKVSAWHSGNAFNKMLALLGMHWLFVVNMFQHCWRFRCCCWFLQWLQWMMQMHLLPSLSCWCQVGSVHVGVFNDMSCHCTATTSHRMSDLLCQSRHCFRLSDTWQQRHTSSDCTDLNQ